MKYAVNSHNGNLTFTLEGAADRDTIERLLENEHMGDEGKLADMLDSFGYSGNGVFESISASDVGALTDAPMFSDDVHRDDSGTVLHVGNVWWYEPYQVANFLEVLLSTGAVTFNAAPENVAVDAAIA
ncbi:hypothetical protein [Comamonas thiooxydans]|uniref:hypothetical protein n=1 Tax=Comamonas thiooxydans TaxID=363952 RepID=UPI000B41AFD2|nr:hypothetical protein [Comamonas thiooxydans]